MVNVEKLENSQVLLTVEISGEDWTSALDRAFKTVVKDVKEDGFRQGKMPKPMFLKKYGVESLYPEAIEEALQVKYPTIIEESGITPVAQPELDVETVDQEKVVVKLTVAVKPEVTLGEYKGLIFNVETAEVTEEEIDAEIAKLQDRHAELVIKDTAVETGDTAVIDFEGFKDGEAFEGGKGENYPLEIGSGSFIPGFEEQLVGLNAGESKDVEVSFPENYHAEDLAGAPVVFKVTVHEVKNRQVPELSDEFVADVNIEGVTTVEELKADARTKLEAKKASERDNAITDQLVDIAAENATIEIPEAMTANELGRMLQEFEQNLSQSGLNLEGYYQYTGMTEEQLREQMTPDAKKRISYNLTLEAIAAAEGLEATLEEAEAELATMATQYGIEVEQLKMYIGGVERLQDDLKIKKAIEFLKENAAA
jgi:trigger factor